MAEPPPASDAALIAALSGLPPERTNPRSAEALIGALIGQPPERTDWIPQSPGPGQRTSWLLDLDLLNSRRGDAAGGP
jgi:hypothetical protein